MDNCNNYFSDNFNPHTCKGSGFQTMLQSRGCVDLNFPTHGRACQSAKCSVYSSLSSPASLVHDMWNAAGRGSNIPQNVNSDAGAWGASILSFTPIWIMKETRQLWPNDYNRKFNSTKMVIKIWKNSVKGALGVWNGYWAELYFANDCQSW